MKNSKTLLSQINRLLTLLDESTDIFFAERPFLENPDAEKKILKDSRREENELKIQATATILIKELEKLQKKRPPMVQSSLLTP